MRLQVLQPTSLRLPAFPTVMTQCQVTLFLCLLLCLSRSLARAHPEKETIALIIFFHGAGATQFMPIPGPYATGAMPPQTVGPMMFPAPGTGYPGNAYQMPSNAGSLALNTYQPYPYGPLPYGNINPIVPYPQYATAPLTPYGMLQPGPQTTVTITNNKDPVTVTMPQQPDWVNFPAVMLDPAGAPFGSTASTAAAYNSYASSVKPGVTFIPQVNYTFIRYSVCLLYSYADVS
jgi:hypothetical protein